MLGTPQTTFGLDNPSAKAGMILSRPENTKTETLVCGAAALDFGIVVELVNGLAIIAQGTGDPDANKVYGITVYKDSLEQAAPGVTGSAALPYQPGDDVVVMRIGVIAAQCVSGTTVTPGGAVNFAHSSTGANPQGLITSAAASGTAGSEVSAWPNGAAAYDKKDLGLASASVPLVAVQLNAP